jgi:UDP-N-acetylmuramate dehydrogenase
VSPVGHVEPPDPGGPVAEARARLGDRARVGEPLGPLTTYRVGGPATLFVRIDDEDDLAAVADAVRGTGVPTLAVGKGSNLLVADAGFDGLAVTLGEAFATVEIDGTGVRAGAGAALPVVARRTAAAGLTGFEWAVGVPGSIGGAVRMNAGGHGSDMAASLERVRVLDLRTGEDEEVPAAALHLGFRRSSIAGHHLVVRADLRLTEGDRARAEAAIAEIVRWRRAHQPGGANAGSVFVNPPGDASGRLVELAGAKGLRIGTAAVSTKHANFIIADEGGRADDVFALMLEVQRRVREATGVLLRSETRLVGFPASALSEAPGDRP